MSKQKLPTKFSVITPSFNQAEFIQRTIDSILHQQGNFEVESIVVDGQSTDRSLEILKQYGDRIQLISESDTGQSNAINKGLKLATGDIVCWLNSDDLFLPKCLETVCNVFSAEPATQWVYGKVKIVDTDDREIRQRITAYKNRRMRTFKYANLLQECWISQMGVFWRKSFGDRIGGLDESLDYSMDYDLWLRFGKHSPGRFIDQYLAAFRWHGGSKTSQNYVKQMAESYRLAKTHAEGKYWQSLLVHQILGFRTRLAYRVLQWIGK